MNCYKCGKKMINGQNKFGEFVECVACDVRAYGDGTQADAVLRRLRHAAHDVFDAYWQGKKMDRNVAYKEMAKVLGIPKEKAHMRFMDKAQCEQVIKIYKEVSHDC
jgi:hypothetical protein